MKYIASEHFPDTFSTNISKLGDKFILNHFLIMLIKNVIGVAFHFSRSVFAVAN